MLLSDWLRWVFQAVTTARLRSLLTALGISVGIAAVTLLTSIGEGLRVYLLDSFSQFGTRIVAVTPGKTETHGLAGLVSTIRPLSLEDARHMAQLPHVDAVVPLVQGTAKIEAGRYSRDTDVYGVGPEMDRAWRFGVAAGRFLPADAFVPAGPDEPGVDLPGTASVAVAVAGGIVPQARKAIENMLAILEEAGYGREHIVRCGVWLDDTRDFWSFNKVYAEYFGGEHAPARACVQSMMMVDCKVEIDCVCYKPPA